MSITRVTQSMMMERSLGGMQMSLARLARTQEQLSTGRVLNRPSDSPTDTTSAMRIRSSISNQAQFVRNAEDGMGWLGQVDNTLTSMTDQVRRARDLALQGANTGAGSTASREALATEVDQIRASLVASANTSYLGRPIFGGITAGTAAYDAAGTYVGTPGSVDRTVAEGVTIRVDVDGNAVFGPAGSSLFDGLTALAADLRSANSTGMRTGIATLNTAMDRITTTLADVGTRYNRLDQAAEAAKSSTLNLTSSLSEIENTDLPRATVDLKMQEVAYQAALSATSRVMQPSLLDFLR